MKTLTQRIYDIQNDITKPNVVEGGNAGHMAHPIDYNDFTCQDLKDMISDLFDSKVTGITEKLDGTNIQATMNEKGEVVFIRNKTDLNSYKGGMTIEDMYKKWESLPNVQNTFVKAGEIITQVFNKLGTKWFNPDGKTRVIVNCECITSGITNIMPYAKDQVSFHDLWIFKRNDIGWEHTLTTKDGVSDLEKACDGIDNAHLTPNVIIKITSTSSKLKDFYRGELDKLFSKRTQTVGEWKKEQFISYMQNSSQYTWIAGMGKRAAKNYLELLYKRFFEGDMSTNLKTLKSMAPGHEADVDALCKEGYKKIMAVVMKSLDRLFIKLGNDVIALCDGLTNTGLDASAAVETIQKNLKDTIAEIKGGDNEVAKDKLTKQLDRMTETDSTVNPTEGIVFSYKGKLMKLTGSFGALNQILGSIKFSR